MESGIVRRVDDLGRIVIPKEIRRQMGIKESDPIEIIPKGDSIVLKKFNANLSAHFEEFEAMVREHGSDEYDSRQLAELYEHINWIKKLLK